jgi:hypothetical protein
MLRLGIAALFGSISLFGVAGALGLPLWSSNAQAATSRHPCIVKCHLKPVATTTSLALPTPFGLLWAVNSPPNPVSVTSGGVAVPSGTIVITVNGAVVESFPVGSLQYVGPLPVGNDRVRALYLGGESYRSSQSAVEVVSVPKATCVVYLEDDVFPDVSATMTCDFLWGPPDTFTAINPPAPTNPLELICNGEVHPLSLTSASTNLGYTNDWLTWTWAISSSETPINAYTTCGGSGHLAFRYPGDANYGSSNSPTLTWSS